jgi:ribonuclease BN (tRNA processing enzyme)
MAESLTLVPVGVGAAYARPGEAQSCYLVRGAGAAVCLDMGAGALNRLQGYVAPEDLDAVVITHLHPDHCVDLLSLRVYMAYGPGSGRRLRVLGPPDLRARLGAFGGEDGWDEAFRFEPLHPGAPVDIATGLRLTAAEVPHLAPTFALRLDVDGGSLCYGADCTDNAALPALAAGCDLLLLECSFGAADVPPGAMHLNAPQAGALAREARAGSLLLTHCYPEHDQSAALAAARRDFGGDVGWARKGEAVAA